MFRTILLGRPFGIGTYVHWTFWFLLLFIGLSNAALGLMAIVHSIVLVCGVFGCVVLHELGHALMARRFGIRTLDIYLYPIGGAARLERMPERPAQEFLIAIAGPAVNAVIAVLFYILIRMGHVLVDVSGTLAGQAIGGVGGYLNVLLLANIILGLFNLLPAFPMDGGRILRAVLATRKDYLSATETAARIGKWMAGGFALLGVFTGHPMIIVLAGFIYLAGQQELLLVRMRHGTFVVRGAMFDDVIDVTPPEPLQRSVRRNTW